MITLSIIIEQREGGIHITDNSTFSGDTVTTQEQAKFDLFWNAFREAVVKEAERLAQKGCGKTNFGTEGETKLDLKEDKAFKRKDMIVLKKEGDGPLCLGRLLT